MYLRLLIFLLPIWIPACTSSSPAFHMIYSAYKLNNQGDNIQSWHTPFSIWNHSVVPCPVVTVASWHAHRFLRRHRRWSGLLISWRIFHSVLWCTHQRLWCSQFNKAEVDVFLEFSCFFYGSDGCCRFDLWLLCLFKIQLEHLEVLGSHTVETMFEGFWALLC